ncbi:MAG: hypothetical protein AVDCRST_MAG93-5776 [uncultured Chloroflexia bacterium]|uniref:Replication-relaxation n=1 Tax=uncultured Chloroflexia bacterium TaxID=1672391 RepID=A0A6J4L3Z4_9CHLR|nr:MAG: hypothetical protein AVDCRST_MAG93-5776 [uncultured Chloroflexia bacterium]
MSTKNGKDYRGEDVEREIVRMLWLFHFATTDQLCRLLWNDGARSSRRKLVLPLRRLYDMHMIWREPRRTSPGYRSHLNGRAASGWSYGLTETGRMWATEAMPELTSLRCTTREGYMHNPDRRTITHSTHHTEFCTRIIERLRGDTSTVAIFIETESTVLGNHLRMDGLVRLRLRHHAASVVGQPRDERMPWHVPWLPTLRAPALEGTFDATFAIEIDEGTESLPILEAKAQNYRRTFMHGMLTMQRMRTDGGAYDLSAEPWHLVLCPPNIDPAEAVAYFPIPVVVMNSETRLANVSRVWNRGWPNSEVRMTTWEHLGRARSLMSAHYLNQDEQWVDLLGNIHDER